MCDFTLHNNEKYETILNQGWCVTLHQITIKSVRLYSMKRGVCDFTFNEKCETIWKVACDFASHIN